MTNDVNWPRAGGDEQFELPIRKCYAVAVGRKIGVHLSWDSARLSTAGYKGSRHRKFQGTDARKQAEEWIKQESGPCLDGARECAQRIKPTPNEPKSGKVKYVYTDGACKNNGRNGAKAGVGVYFGEGDPRNVSEPLAGRQTNNVAEVTAILLACKSIARELELEPDSHWVIITDSNYAIGYASSSGARQDAEGWKKDIPNKQLVRHLYEVVTAEPRIALQKVAAHTNCRDVHSLGNAEADKLAVRGACMPS